jgi:tripartite-type tricarboxylate transporter receptor subunit TctC
MKIKYTLAAIAGLAIQPFIGSAPALAEYPEKPVEVIIPFGAGGNADSAGRVFINALRKEINADIVALNMAGAGGTIGTARLAEAQPDGYTLGFNPIATVTIQPHLRPVPYGKSSFAPICMVADNPIAVTVAPDSPYSSIQELIQGAQDNKLVVAGTAAGSLPHIAHAAFAKNLGVDFTYLPVTGGAHAAKSILGGEATLATDNSALGDVQGLKTLAVMAQERIEQYPDAPTLKEAGVDLSLTIWMGVFAPAGTPDAVVNKLSAACENVVQDEAFKTQMQAANFILNYKGRDEFTEFFASQYDGNRKILEDIGMVK